MKKRLLALALALLMILPFAAACGEKGNQDLGEEVKVSFNLNYVPAPAAPSPIIVNLGSNYGDKLPVVTRDKFDFLGWYTSGNSDGALVNAETEVTNKNDHTLYAKWASNVAPVIVTLDLNGGYYESLGSTVQENNGVYTVKYEVKSNGTFGIYGAIPSPEKEGASFLGWYTSALGGTEVTSNMSVCAPDHTLYARYKDMLWDFSDPGDEAYFESFALGGGEYPGVDSISVENEQLKIICSEDNRRLLFRFDSIPENYLISFDLTYDGLIRIYGIDQYDSPITYTEFVQTAGIRGMGNEPGIICSGTQTHTYVIQRRAFGIYFAFFNYAGEDYNFQQPVTAYLDNLMIIKGKDKIVTLDPEKTVWDFSQQDDADYFENNKVGADKGFTGAIEEYQTGKYRLGIEALSFGGPEVNTQFLGDIAVGKTVNITVELDWSKVTAFWFGEDGGDGVWYNNFSGWGNVGLRSFSIIRKDEAKAVNIYATFSQNQKLYIHSFIITELDPDKTVWDMSDPHDAGYFYQNFEPLNKGPAGIVDEQGRLAFSTDINVMFTGNVAVGKSVIITIEADWSKVTGLVFGEDAEEGVICNRIELWGSGKFSGWNGQRSFIFTRSDMNKPIRIWAQDSAGTLKICSVTVFTPDPAKTEWDFSDPADAYYFWIIYNSGITSSGLVGHTEEYAPGQFRLVLPLMKEGDKHYHVYFAPGAYAGMEFYIDMNLGGKATGFALMRSNIGVGDVIQMTESWAWWTSSAVAAMQWPLKAVMPQDGLWIWMENENINPAEMVVFVNRFKVAEPKTSWDFSDPDDALDFRIGSVFGGIGYTEEYAPGQYRLVLPLVKEGAKHYHVYFAPGTYAGMEFSLEMDLGGKATGFALMDGPMTDGGNTLNMDEYGAEWGGWWDAGKVASIPWPIKGTIPSGGLWIWMENENINPAEMVVYITDFRLTN